jgi:hypothetical protein
MAARAAKSVALLPDLGGIVRRVRCGHRGIGTMHNSVETRALGRFDVPTIELERIAFRCAEKPPPVLSGSGRGLR